MTGSGARQSSSVSKRPVSGVYLENLHQRIGFLEGIFSLDVGLFSACFLSKWHPSKSRMRSSEGPVNRFAHVR